MYVGIFKKLFFRPLVKNKSPYTLTMVQNNLVDTQQLVQAVMSSARQPSGGVITCKNKRLFGLSKSRGKQEMVYYRKRHSTGGRRMCGLTIKLSYF